jgi:hypothetical protein
MVLLAASIPTLRPLMRGVHLSKSRGDSSGERGGSHALQKWKQNTFGSYPRRDKNDEDREILHQLEVGVGRGSFRNEEDMSDGISKTTTVTVSA